MNETLEATLLTLRIALTAVLIASLIGVPAALWMDRARAPLRAPLRILVHTLYGLPPIVAGLLVYLLLSARGPVGDLGWLFTPRAIILAEVLLATPLVAGLTLASLAGIPRPTREMLEGLGPGPVLAAKWRLREARAGVASALLVGFGRSTSEVAAALVVGGNIQHETRTLATATLLNVNRGDFDQALLLAGILLALSLGTYAILARLRWPHPEPPA